MRSWPRGDREAALLRAAEPCQEQASAPALGFRGAQERASRSTESQVLPPLEPRQASGHRGGQA